jgi:hypothetical protein
VWRTGANAATQFTTSAPITLAGLAVPAGTYTLWTVPRANGSADLIVNKQNGQWGTEYDGTRDLGKAHLQTETTKAPVEAFTIAIVGLDDRRGTLSIEWGPFRWTAPLVVAPGEKKEAKRRPLSVNPLAAQSTGPLVSLGEPATNMPRWLPTQTWLHHRRT